MMLLGAEKKRHVEKNIWNHDNRLLSLKSDVAAMTDAHNIPPLWIQARIVEVIQSRSEVRYVVQDVEENQDNLVSKRYLHKSFCVCFYFRGLAS